MSPTSPEVLAAQFEAHMKFCDERAQRDHADMNRIADSMNKLGEKVEGGLVRVHKRIDESEKATSTVKVGALIAILSLLLSIIGYLLINGVPWQVGS